MKIKQKVKDFRNSIIDKVLEKLEIKISEDNYMCGYVDLDTLTDDKKEEAFERFSEGNEEMYNLLKDAYSNGIKSMFSCSGHGDKYLGYVVFCVNDENIEKLRKISKLVSHENIVTSFEDNSKFGKRVFFSPLRSESKDWKKVLNEAIINPPEEDIEPTIYYHEEMLKRKDEYKFAKNIRKKIFNGLNKIRFGGDVKMIDTYKIDYKEHFSKDLKKQVVSQEELIKNEETMTDIILQNEKHINEHKI